MSLLRSLFPLVALFPFLQACEADDCLDCGPCGYAGGPAEEAEWAGWRVGVDPEGRAGIVLGMVAAGDCGTTSETGVFLPVEGGGLAIEEATGVELDEEAVVPGEDGRSWSFEGFDWEAVILLEELDDGSIDLDLSLDDIAWHVRCELDAEAERVACGQMDGGAPDA